MKPEFDFENNNSLEGRKIPFSLPEGYFESLEEKIMSRIWLQSLGEESTGLEINNEYFDSLPDVILFRINIGEGNNIETGFTVPDGYFAQNPGQILKHQKVKVITKRRVFFRHQTLSRIAAVAACLIIGIVFILRNQTNPSSFDESLNELSATEISNNLQHEDITEETLLPYLDFMALDDHVGTLEKQELLNQLTEEDLILTDI